MDFNFSEEVEVECKCGTVFNQKVSVCKEDAEIVSSHEREMGTETEYELVTESFLCPNCDKEYRAIFRVWEYPVGALNMGPEVTVEEV